MDLGEAGVGEQRATLVGAEGGCDIAATGVRREVEDIAVTAGAEQDGIGRMAGDFTRIQIADDDSLRVAIDQHEIEHFRARKHFHRAQGDLVAEAGVGSEKKLLAGLSAGVEGARNLSTAEGAVVEQAAILAGEGHALSDALVDDRAAHFGKAMHIGLAGAEIAAFDRVVEEAVNAVAVILVIFCGVDTTLRGDRVGAAGTVLIAEAFHFVALLCERCSCRGAGETGSDNDELELPLVGGADELRVVFVIGPLLIERTGGDVGVECHCAAPFPSPRARIAIGIET